MTYYDSEGNSAFIQPSDIFNWCGREMVRFYYCGDFYFEFWDNFIKRFNTISRG